MRALVRITAMLLIVTALTAVVCSAANELINRLPTGPSPPVGRAP